MCTECVGNSISEIVDSSCGEGMFGLVRRSSILEPCSVFPAKQVPARRVPSENDMRERSSSSPMAAQVSATSRCYEVRGGCKSPQTHDSLALLFEW